VSRVLQFLRVTFDPDTGLLSGLSNLETRQTIKLTQNFYWRVKLPRGSSAAPTLECFITYYLLHVFFN